MTWFLLAVSTVGLFLAGVIKGATGLGYASCALPILAMSIGLKPAMALVLIPTIVTNFAAAVNTGHLSAVFLRFSHLYLAMVPGIALGVLALASIGGSSVPATVLGVVMMIYAAFSLWGPRVALSPAAGNFLQIPTGFLNGLVTGLTGSQVMPLFPYAMALNLAPAQLVQVVNLAVLLATAVLGFGLLAASLMTTDLLFLSVLATFPSLLGVEVGRRLRAHIPHTQFRAYVLWVLFFMGGMLVFRA